MPHASLSLWYRWSVWRSRWAAARRRAAPAPPLSPSPSPACQATSECIGGLRAVLAAGTAAHSIFSSAAATQPSPAQPNSQRFVDCGTGGALVPARQARGVAKKHPSTIQRTIKEQLSACPCSLRRNVFQTVGLDTRLRDLWQHVSDLPLLSPWLRLLGGQAGRAGQAVPHAPMLHLVSSIAPPITWCLQLLHNTPQLKKAAEHALTCSPLPNLPACLAPCLHASWCKTRRNSGQPRARRR